MSVKATRVPPPPQPLPDITEVHVTNYSPGGPWQLFLKPFTGGFEPLVAISDNLDQNHYGIYMRPNEARELADLLFELATQAEKDFDKDSEAC